MINLNKQKIKLKIIAMFVILLAFVGLMQVKVNAANGEIHWTVTEGETTTKTFEQGEWEKSIIYYINQGRTHKITDDILAKSQNIYCIDPETNFRSGATYRKMGDTKTYSYSNNPEIAWIVTSGINNIVSGAGHAQLQTSIPQLAVWRVLRPDFNKVDYSMAENLYKQAKAYADFGEKVGTEYTNPSVSNTTLKVNNNLVGPYKIDYMMGEYEDTYVCGIIEMTMRDEDGNIVKYSIEDLGTTARWYIANADGTVFTSGYGPNGNYPKPNQEFYIKLGNFSKTKAKVNFRIQKVKCWVEAITLNGVFPTGTTTTTGEHQCADCKNLDKYTHSCTYTSYYFTTPKGNIVCGRCGTPNPSYIAQWGISMSSHYHRCKANNVTVNCGIYKEGGYRFCDKYDRETGKHHCGGPSGEEYPAGNDGKGNEWDAGEYSCHPNHEIPINPTSQQTELYIPHCEISYLDLMIELELDSGIDLSLRKFITGLNGQDITNRVPRSRCDTTKTKNRHNSNI